VEELKMQLETAQRMSAGSLPPGRVPPPPSLKQLPAQPPHGESKLQQKSGWLQKKGGMMNTLPEALLCSTRRHAHLVCLRADERGKQGGKGLDQLLWARDRGRYGRECQVSLVLHRQSALWLDNTPD